MKYEVVIGLEVHSDHHQNLLQLQDILRRRSEYQCMPCLPRPAGRAAGPE